MKNRKEENIEFERCIEVLTRLIEQYGSEVLEEAETKEAAGKLVKVHKKGIA